MNGKGWTGASYNASIGMVTFDSLDGLGFSTEILKGANVTNNTNGTNDTNGKGWTSGSYNASIGVVTFVSNDGLGFVTGNLKGANGTNGTKGTNGTNGTNGRGITNLSLNTNNQHVINYNIAPLTETTNALTITSIATWSSLSGKPFTVLDTTSYSPSATQTECEVNMYPRAAGANTLLSGRFWADKAFKYAAGSTSGGVISTYLPPYLSLDIKTDALEIDANGKLNVKAGSSKWTTSGTKIYYNAGFIGMNTTNPIYRLEVIDDTTYIAAFRHTNLTQGTGIGLTDLLLWVQMHHKI